jgi:hypothetical protein
MRIVTIEDKNAVACGQFLSARTPEGNLTVTYADPKNGRLVLNIYPKTDENVKRIAGQIKMFKAHVFERGRQLDTTNFTGA